MEFDDLTTFILLFLFFILPSILKRWKGKNKKGGGVKKKSSSILGKLGEGIQNFVRELEKQAQAAKANQAAGKQEQGSVWDNLAESTKDGVEHVLPREPDPEKKSVPEFHDPAPPFVSPPKVPAPISKPALTKTGTCTRLPGISGRLPANALQQAVIWSEILGKPVALKND